MLKPAILAAIPALVYPSRGALAVPSARLSSLEDQHTCFQSGVGRHLPDNLRGSPSKARWAARQIEVYSLEITDHKLIARRVDSCHVNGTAASSHGYSTSAAAFVELSRNPNLRRRRPEVQKGVKHGDLAAHLVDRDHVHALGDAPARRTQPSRCAVSTDICVCPPSPSAGQRKSHPYQGIWTGDHFLPRSHPEVASGAT